MQYITIDVPTAGWAAVQTLRNYAGKRGLVIHAHRAMHGALIQHSCHGIYMLASDCTIKSGINS